jgi:tripeptidyl-peptidase-2
MSSPNACGCIALLLSAAKANKMSVSSAMVRRAVQNSAQLIDGVSVLGQGYGLIQVSPAWHHMQLLAEDRWAGVHYNVTVQGDRFKRGIYLRGDVETCSKDTFKVQIDAIFKDNATVEEKIAYEVRMHLETTADWVKCPPKLLMVKSEKVITVSVDPSKLLPGVHVAFVNVYDEANMERGVLFRVPVTVCKPVVIARGVTDLDLGLLTFDVDSRIRDFIILPPGCTYIDVVVRDARSITDATKDSVDLTPRLLVVHAVQLYSGVAYRDNEKQVHNIL